MAVRRTRSFVKRFYPNDTVRIGGREQPITFPTPRVRRVVYDLDAVLPDFFDRIALALDPDAGPDDPEALTLARYAPSQYRRDRALETYELQLAGLLRSGLLKRFESSPHAFSLTCERMAASHDAFLSLLDSGRVATGEALADWIATDSDDIDEVDTYLDGHIGLTDDAAQYEVAQLRSHVERDRDLLRSFAATARTVTRVDDPTLAELVEQLAAIATEAESTGLGAGDTRDRRKVLIFSYYADTVDWIVEFLEEMSETDPRLAAYRGRIASLSGSTAAPNKDAVVWGFAPRTTDAPQELNEDRYDIVVTTDVLAEGVNLQQARHIINYDLPWNPMRLVQRHGRIDRIGSRHAEVFVRCIFPDSRLDDLLGLEERLHRKLTHAAASIGVGEVLPDQVGSDISFTETREEIERIRREDAGLFERGGTARGVLSGEEYRQELRRAMEQGYGEQIEELPWGSGSGMAVNSGGERPGYVFCVQVGDWTQPLFRYVEPADGEGGDGGDGSGTGEPLVIAETLACLDRARPPDGFRYVPGAGRRRLPRGLRRLGGRPHRRRQAMELPRRQGQPRTQSAPGTAARRRDPALASPGGAYPGRGRSDHRRHLRPLPRTHHPHLPGRHGRHRGSRRAGCKGARGGPQPRARALHPTPTATRDHPRRRPPRLLAGPGAPYRMIR